MTWKSSIAKGETIEMRTDFPDVPVTTVVIASAVRRKITWKVTAKEKKLRMRNIAVQ